jgi:CxxC motif-containing protein (DUF1111 family)
MNSIGIGAAVGLLTAGFVGYQTRPMPLGSVYEGTTTRMNARAREGRAMFAISWDADKGKAFNERACVSCHSEPTIGGRATFGQDPVFVLDPKSPTGWRNVQRAIRKKDGSVDSVVPAPKGVVRKSSAMYGSGLIEGIPDATLLAIADPADKNGDGISGRRGVAKDGVGRFGWKASFAKIDNFVLDAFHIELGVTPHHDTKNPESTMDMNQIGYTSIYIRMLAAPSPAADIAQFKGGADIFKTVGCGSCHTPAHKTAKHEVPALSEKTIAVYSDFLLHEMGGTDLHSSPKIPSATEVRTPALWGLGKVGGPFMHDNRAQTLEQAIRAHGGEGKASADAYDKLSPENKKLLIDWLKRI